MSAPLTIVVDAPVVRGGRVFFSWTHPGGSALQRRTRWRAHFVGVRLDRLPRAAIWDVFLSLQLRVWAGEPGPVTVVLPEGVPVAQLEWWSAVHGSDHVTLQTRGAPLPSAPAPPTRPGRIAVSFGGGKDSSLALSVLRGSRRRRDVLPVHVIQHSANARRARLETALRSALLVVLPTAVATRSAVRVVDNDFLATLTAAGRRRAPHVNFYGPALLPLLMAEGVETITFSRTAAGYRSTPRADGSLRFSNPTGRREQLEATSDYLAAVHGYPLSLQGTHEAVSELVSYTALAALDPAAARRVVMCMRTTRMRRWCLACSKCLEHGLFALATGVQGRGFDPERAFTSPRAQRLAEAARRSAGERTAWGIAPYHPEIGTRTHFASFCHALHRAGLRLGPERMTATPGLRNLRDMHAAWARPFPGAASIDPDAITAAAPLAQEVARAALEVVPARTDAQLARPGLRDEPRMLVGDEPAGAHHGAVMPTPRLDAWRQRWVRPAPGTSR